MIDFLVLGIATFIGLYMAVNIGANDLANAMGTSVGSGAITIKKAVLISMIANTLGAVLAGGYVTTTISKGMINPALFAGSPDKLMYGMFAALLAAGIWVNLATVFGLPVSTTHSIVGAVVGFGIISVGAGSVSWGKITTIAVSWIVSPAAGATIAGAMFYFLEKKIMTADVPDQAAEFYAPFLVFLVFLVLILSVIFKALKNIDLHLGVVQTTLATIPIAAVFGFLGRGWVRWQVGRKYQTHAVSNNHSSIERIFAQLQILTACYVAFAHGANDVANAVGPLAAIFSVISTKSVALKVEVPFWMLFIGGIAVGGGLFVFGKRVMETIGGNITEITPTRGFCAEFGAATTILVCSLLGMPISTTHVLVGSVVGVGLMRGLGVLDLRILKNIGMSWLVTLPFTMVLAMVFYKLIIYFFV